MKRNNYRVFTNDIGPCAYSAYCGISAGSLPLAKGIARELTDGLRKLRSRKLRVLVLPESRREIWPDGETGKVDAAKVAEFVVEVP